MLNKKIIVIVVICLIGISSAYATIRGPLFNDDWPEYQDWYIGTNLKQGNYFSYEICEINYKDCQVFQMDFWIEDKVTIGEEELWKAKVVIHDGNVTKIGYMYLGTIRAEPIEYDRNIQPYVFAFKESVAWLSFVNSGYVYVEEPKDTSEKCIKFRWCN